MLILANHVYAIPPNADLVIDPPDVQGRQPLNQGKPPLQIDLLFISLAEAMGARAIGIVLSGYDGDVTEGCRHIKANGGTTFAQDMSAEVGAMSLSAQASGCVDFVLPPRQDPSGTPKIGPHSCDKEEARV